MVLEGMCASIVCQANTFLSSKEAEMDECCRNSRLTSIRLFSPFKGRAACVIIRICGKNAAFCNFAGGARERHKMLCHPVFLSS